jgi:hypothetical protein
VTEQERFPGHLADFFVRYLYGGCRIVIDNNAFYGGACRIVIIDNNAFILFNSIPK